MNSNKLEFKLVQPGEFEDYYYEVYHDGDLICQLLWSVVDNEFMIGNFSNYWLLGNQILIDVGSMVGELNAATKADKIFGFL